MTLVFPIRGQIPTQSEVLLGEKVKPNWFGSGLIHGFGGKQENGESICTTAVRELRDESGLVTKEEDLDFCGVLKVHVEGEPEERLVYLFRLYTWEGEPQSTDEMAPIWYHFSTIPTRKMFPDTNSWLLHILLGKNHDFNIFYKRGMKSLKSTQLLSMKDRKEVVQ